MTPIEFSIPPLTDLSTRTPASTSGGKPPRRRRLWPIVAALAIAVAGLVAWLVVSSSAQDDDPAPEPVVEAPVGPPPADGSGADGDPDVAPIGDALDVVEMINDNRAEAELLEDLGLDPSGNPLPGGD